MQEQEFPRVHRITEGTHRHHGLRLPALHRQPNSASLGSPGSSWSSAQAWGCHHRRTDGSLRSQGSQVPGFHCRQQSHRCSFGRPCVSQGFPTHHCVQPPRWRLPGSVTGKPCWRLCQECSQSLPVPRKSLSGSTRIHVAGGAELGHNIHSSSLSLLPSFPGRSQKRSTPRTPSQALELGWLLLGGQDLGSLAVPAPRGVFSSQRTAQAPAEVTAGSLGFPKHLDMSWLRAGARTEQNQNILFLVENPSPELLQRNYQSLNELKNLETGSFKFQRAVC